MLPLPIQLRLHPKETQLPCDKTFNLDPSYPIYYNISTYAYNGTRYKSVLYFVYYQKNLAIGLNSTMPNNPSLGYHDKDIERLIVLHDMQTNEPKYVYTSGHAQEGEWTEYKKCKLDGDHLVIYSALYSHRHSTRAKTYWRMFGFANDHTSDKGKHINMQLVNDTTLEYDTTNREVLDTAFRSFFYPLYIKSLPKLKDDQRKRDLAKNSGV
jgi:mRNA-degrading endonuclease YafQ of YafQ-DinJ toxin-antitoxin module